MNTKRSHPKLRIALAVILAVILVCAAAFAVYISIYYHAESAAVQAMSPDSAVLVYELKDGITVFAPEGPSAGFIFYPGGKVEHTAYAPLLPQATRENSISPEKINAKNFFICFISCSIF